MQEQTGGAPAATQEPMKLDVSVRLIDPVKPDWPCQCEIQRLFWWWRISRYCKAKKGFMQVCPASRTETGATVT